MAKLWLSSACNNFQSACYMLSLQKKRKKEKRKNTLENVKYIQKIDYPQCQWAEKSLLTFGNSYLTLFEENMKCRTLLTSYSCLTFWLAYIHILWPAPHLTLHRLQVFTWPYPHVHTLTLYTHTHMHLFPPPPPPNCHPSCHFAAFKLRLQTSVTSKTETILQ